MGVTTLVRVEVGTDVRVGISEGILCWVNMGVSIWLMGTPAVGFSVACSVGPDKPPLSAKRKTKLTATNKRLKIPIPTKSRLDVCGGGDNVLPVLGQN